MNHHCLQWALWELQLRSTSEDAIVWKEKKIWKNMRTPIKIEKISQKVDCPLWVCWSKSQQTVHQPKTVSVISDSSYHCSSLVSLDLKKRHRSTTDSPVLLVSTRAKATATHSSASGSKWHHHHCKMSVEDASATFFLNHYMIWQLPRWTWITNSLHQ